MADLLVEGEVYDVTWMPMVGRTATRTVPMRYRFREGDKFVFAPTEEYVGTKMVRLRADWITNVEAH